MKRIALFSLVPVALIAAVAAAPRVSGHFAYLLSADGGSCGPHDAKATHMADGGSCEAPVEEKATHTAGSTEQGRKDPVMAMVCENTCAVKDYREEMVVAQAKARVGDLTRCPVSGVVFTVTATNPDVVHRGVHYRLCCGGCEKKFRADPAHFVS